MPLYIPFKGLYGVPIYMCIYIYVHIYPLTDYIGYLIPSFPTNNSKSSLARVAPLISECRHIRYNIVQNFVHTFL